MWFYGKLKDFTALPEGSRAEAARLQEESRVIKEQRARKSWFTQKDDKEMDAKRILEEQ